MSLLQRMKLLHTRDDDEQDPAALLKGVALDGSPEFAIKAVQAGAAADQRPVIRISASASVPSSPAAAPQLSPGPVDMQDASPSPYAEYQLETAFSTPAAAMAAAAPVGHSAQHAGPVLPLLRGYRSLAQFSPSVELYRSSQSVVLRATCIASRQPVIVKQYFKKKMSSRAVHKMRREVDLMYLLRGQQGVAQILGDFQDDRHYCIVMEYYAGGDLYKRAMMGKGDKTLTQQWICSKVIAPLLRVLSVLHDQHGIVHRDIKPENVFLSDSDELMLGDFGLAIQQHKELPFLKAGTLDYMAPEVVQNPLVDCIDECAEYSVEDLRRHGFVPYTEKVDCWAVGVLAYELMMQGETPFYHDEPTQTEQLILKCDLVEVKFPRQHLLSPWADFVRTTLQLDPARRPSASQLLRHRWVQMHVQARARPPLPPLRSASIMAALERSTSMPPMVLAALLRPAAAAGPGAGAEHPATRAPAPSPAGASSAALQLLADTAAGQAAAAAGPLRLESELPASLQRPHSVGGRSLCSRLSLAAVQEAAGVEEEEHGEEGGLSANPSGASSCRCRTLTAEPARRCSHCLACSGSGSSLAHTPSDLDMAEAELSPPDTGCTLPPGAPAREADADLAMEMDMEFQPPRRRMPALSLPLPRELAAMRLAAPLAPPLLGPARVPTAAELGSFVLVPQLTPKPGSSPAADIAGLIRKPSRLSRSMFAPAPPNAGAGPAPSFEAALMAAAAASNQSFTLPGPQSLRRMGRTGSIFRPPPPQGVSMDSPLTPRSLPAGPSPSAGSPGLGGVQTSGGSSAAASAGGSARPSFAAIGSGGGMVRASSDMRMGTSGQRNRLVAYLRRQTATAVGLMRRLRVSKRTMSVGGAEDDSRSTSSASGASDGREVSGGGSPVAPNSLSP